MFPTDTEIVAHARIWAPYGGPRTSEVFVKFGMTPETYRRRIAELLQEPVTLSITDRIFVLRMLESSPPHGDWQQNEQTPFTAGR